MITLEQLPDTTRIWIYQAQTPFSNELALEIGQHVANFAEQWVSHNRALRAVGEVRHNQFILLGVDESQAGASGCSIDKSVHFMQALEGKYGINLFDRMTFTYQQDGKVLAAPRDEFAALYAAGTIDDETLVFDNLVKTKADFETSWVKPLGESWHKRMV